MLSVTLPQKGLAMAAPKFVPSMQEGKEQRRPSIDSSLDASNGGGKAAGTAAAEAAAVAEAVAASPKKAAGQNQKGSADPKEVNLQTKGQGKRAGCTCTVL